MRSFILIAPACTFEGSHREGRHISAIPDGVALYTPAHAHQKVDNIIL